MFYHTPNAPSVSNSKLFQPSTTCRGKHVSFFSEGACFLIPKVAISSRNAPAARYRDANGGFSRDELHTRDHVYCKDFTFLGK